eukprot:COSAG04_NODE_3313_length_2945_cov_1.987351_2_plen_165_part_01
MRQPDVVLGVGLGRAGDPLTLRIGAPESAPEAATQGNRTARTFFPKIFNASSQRSMRSADASDVPRGKHTVSAHAPGCRRRAKHQSWSHTQAGMRSPRSLRPTPWRSRFLSPSTCRCGGLPTSPGDAWSLLEPSRALRFSAVPFGAGAAREEDGCACSGFALGSC